jgi:hypothetical protein
MAGYIGQRSVTLSTTVANAQDVTATDTTPEVTIINNTHEDTDGGREGKVIFKGQQSGGEESTLAEIEANHSGSSDDEAGQLVFKTNDGNDGATPTEAMRIDAGQNLGLGTNAPTHRLDIVESADAFGARITNNSDGSQGLQVRTSDNDTGQYILDLQTSSSATGTDYASKFVVEKGGNVMIGTTTQDAPVDNGGSGITLRQAGIMLIGGTGTSIYANREDSDGEIMQFRKDGTTVGSIGTEATALAIGHQDTGIKFAHSLDAVLPFNLSTYANRDDAIDIGYGSVRFDDIYATNGTIQTSDENEKQNIASLTSAEITAATAISRLFKTFKWKDKVAEKGDAARTHTGVIAQQVEAAMSDAGLDASKYAFWCSNTWWEKDVEVAAVEANEEKLIEAQDAYTRTDTYYTKDEAPEGATERTRMGVRYPELLAFIGAATEQRLTSIESRLTALEG